MSGDKPNADTEVYAIKWETIHFDRDKELGPDYYSCTLPCLRITGMPEHN